MSNNNGFGRVGRTFGFMAVVAVALNLAFWLGLVYGVFRIAQHFGVL